MVRRLSAEERALWRKLTASVRPLSQVALAEAAVERVPGAEPVTTVRIGSAKVAPTESRRLGTSLDASWDRRLARGLVTADSIVDLHGHGLAAAHALLEQRLERAIERGDRLMLLITGRPPRGDDRPARRGAIRASVGDWLSASRHAGEIAAVRNAHPRHGGAGALYVVFRRRR